MSGMRHVKLRTLSYPSCFLGCTRLTTSSQQVGKHNQQPTAGIQIQEMPVSSAIMSPWKNQVVIHNGKIHCKGWAYSGGGRWPERVELSADGGFSWYAVPLENLSKKGRWTWRTWWIDLPCDVEGWIEIVCRCWDNSLNTQPLSVRAAWNWGLHVTSSAHRISVYSINKTRARTVEKLKQFQTTGKSPDCLLNTFADQLYRLAFGTTHLARRVSYSVVG